MQHSIEAMESSIRESRESLLELQIGRRDTYNCHKTIEVMPKITQDEVTSDLN